MTGAGVRAYLGLGSNLGDRVKNLRESLQRLRCTDGLEILVISPIYETVPVGGPEQPDYLNAVIEIETGLDAFRLLKACQNVEHAMGRVRAERWGARIIDMDILLYGLNVIDDPELIVPHPRMHERAFVLAPLSDIAGGVVHPVLHESIERLFGTIGSEGVKKTDYVIL